MTLKCTNARILVWAISTLVHTGCALFSVEMERAYLSEVNPKYLRANASVNKINKTTKAFTLYFETLEEFGNEVTMTLQLYALYGNEYKKTPVRIMRDICDGFHYEHLWIERLIKDTDHMPKACPILKGKYFIKDFLLDLKDLPASFVVPWQRIKIELMYEKGEIMLARFNGYVTCDHDAELKKLG